jgi:tRNA pseudouridine55 synthase
MHLPKEYLATGKLGELTDTLDLEGTVIQNNSVNNITHHIIEKSLISFGTHYTQTPPIYSALKHEGTPLYKFARTKKLPEEVIEQITKQKSKLVTLHTLELTNVDLPYFSIRTIVSHGTYIRVLLNDIAKKMETCATTHVLTRTAIGPFNINNAIDFSTLTTMESVEQAMISIEQSLDMIN